MTVKQELHALVEQMDDREARMTLAEWKRRQRPGTASPAASREETDIPSFAELVRMPLDERGKYLALMNAEIDYEAHLEWEKLSVADGLDDE
jgi:hypothetical protein